MYLITHYFKFFSFILTAILLSACNTTGTIRLYDGAEKNQHEIVTINLPAAVDLLEVDGKKINSNTFVSKGHARLEVLPGKHFLKARYTEYWGTERTGLLVASSDFYFAVNGQAGDQFMFQHNGPENLVNANNTSSIDDVAIWLVNENTGLKIEPSSSQSFGGFVSDLLGNKEEENKTGEASMQSTVAAQLRYWWKLADENQRESFRLWLNSQK